MMRRNLPGTPGSDKHHILKDGNYFLAELRVYHNTAEMHAHDEKDMMVAKRLLR